MHAGLSTLRAEMHDQHNQLLVLLEHMKDQIAALAPDYPPIRREFREADAGLERRLTDRLVPVETWIRERSRRRKQQG